MKLGTGRDTVSHSLVSQTSDCEAAKGEKLSTRVTVVRVLEVQRVRTQDSGKNEKWLGITRPDWKDWGDRPEIL